MEKNLTIIILTYNSGHIIAECLSRLNFDKYDVVVVDNASSDNSVETVTTNFPKAKIIKLGCNSGYSRGNNAALRQTNSEFSLILNPDSIIKEEDIEIVLKKMISNNKIASAGPLILSSYPINETEKALKLRDIKQNFSGQIDATNNNILVNFISGSVLFLRMDILKKIGLFDENIFMFYEDDELSKRIIENSYFNAIIADAVAFHQEANSSRKSLFNLFKRNWHLKGWSKLYWKQINKGQFRAKISAVKLVFTYFSLSLLKLTTFDREGFISNLGACLGSISFLAGLKAFKNNGEPRP